MNFSRSNYVLISGMKFYPKVPSLGIYIIHFYPQLSTLILHYLCLSKYLWISVDNENSLLRFSGVFSVGYNQSSGCVEWPASTEWVLACHDVKTDLKLYISKPKLTWIFTSEWPLKDYSMVANQWVLDQKCIQMALHVMAHRGRAETVYRKGCPSCSRQHF